MVHSNCPPLSLITVIILMFIMIHDDIYLFSCDRKYLLTFTSKVLALEKSFFMRMHRRSLRWNLLFGVSIRQSMLLRQRVCLNMICEKNLPTGRRRIQTLGLSSRRKVPTTTYTSSIMFPSFGSVLKVNNEIS